MGVVWILYPPEREREREREMDADFWFEVLHAHVHQYDDSEKNIDRMGKIRSFC